MVGKLSALEALFFKRRNCFIILTPKLDLFSRYLKEKNQP